MTKGLIFSKLQPTMGQKMATLVLEAMAMNQKTLSQPARAGYKS